MLPFLFLEDLSMIRYFRKACIYACHNYISFYDPEINCLFEDIMIVNDESNSVLNYENCFDRTS